MYNDIFYGLFRPVRRFLFLMIWSLPGSYLLKAQEDHTHFSAAFQKEKEYRIFLPAGYHQSKERFPVIYYFHVNKGDHRFELEGVAELVKNSRSILVAWNGRSAPNDLRPYNIGYHSNVNYPFQFKDYFPELVHHIDSSYRTVKDRSARAIIGQSMGGFMCFFLAGKYPHLVGTAVNSKGSPEFFVGYPDNHTLYSMRHLFLNLHGVRLRFHSATECELKHLNQEVHQAALQETGLDYEYKLYEGPHKLSPDQFADAFRFVEASFKSPVPVPDRWNHADLYPEFEVWGYHVKSNLAEPGFIVLKGVTKDYLSVQTRKWMPSGAQIEGVKINITTAPIYKPGQHYTVVDYHVNENKRVVSVVQSDPSGRLRFEADHQDHKIAISESEGKAGIALGSYRCKGGGAFLIPGDRSEMQLTLYNLAGKEREGVVVGLSTTHPDVRLEEGMLEAGRIDAASEHSMKKSFTMQVANRPPADGAPHYVRFRLHISDRAGGKWEEDFDVPVFYDVPEFDDIGIDDGDSEIFGSGNGNNIAEPGETIAVYQGSNRVRLFYDDPFLVSEKLQDELQPDKWGDGYALSSVVKISEDCPVGHTIKILACYENKAWRTINRKVTWGYFYLTVGEKK